VKNLGGSVDPDFGPEPPPGMAKNGVKTIRGKRV
jgi:hypothetical protein